jgi:hypothetical protein
LVQQKQKQGPTVTPGGDKDSGTDGDASGSNSRHVLANHYIPKSFEFWPPLWLTRMHPAASADARAADGTHSTVRPAVDLPII